MTTATSPTATLPTEVSEMDRLKLQLMKEKQGRFQAEMVNLQMAQGALQARQQMMVQESTVFSEYLKTTYMLEPHNELGEDGAIKRSPVRSLPAAPAKEG